MKKSSLQIAVCLTILIAGLFLYSYNQKEMVVTALGDSLAYGLGDTNDNGYIGDLVKRFEKNTEKELVVHDYGVPHDTSKDLLNRLSNPEIAEASNRSDFILINIGTNDFLKSTDRLTKFEKDELGTNEEIYKKNLNKIIHTVQEKDHPKAIYILGIYNPKVKWSNMSEVNKAVSNWNRSTIEVTNHHKYTVFIPTDDLFMNKNKQYYFSDNLHPNKKGYALIGKRVFDMINQNSKYR